VPFSFDEYQDDTLREVKEIHSKSFVIVKYAEYQRIGPYSIGDIYILITNTDDSYNICLMILESPVEYDSVLLGISLEDLIPIEGFEI